VRAKEAMAINKSLSSLTDVFAALGNKSVGCLGEEVETTTKT
jgi:hypothetical protein